VGSFFTGAKYIENSKLAGYQTMKNMLLRNEMTKMKEAK